MLLPCVLGRGGLVGTDRFIMVNGRPPPYAIIVELALGSFFGLIVIYDESELEREREREIVATGFHIHRGL